MASPSYFKITTTTPPATNSLTTTDVVLEDWGIDGVNQPFIDRAIKRCSRAAADYCNRDFGIARYSVICRLEQGYRDGHLTLGAKNPIMLPQWPIASIVSLTETDQSQVVTTLIEDTDFEVDRDTGRLYRLDAYQRPRDWWPSVTVNVDLWAGYIMPGQSTAGLPAGALNIPEHLEDAVGRMVFESQRDPFVRSETVEGVGSINYIAAGSGPAADAGNLSADVEDILNNFRAPVVG
jgi:hypothetical protein